MDVTKLWKFVGRRNTYAIQLKNGIYIPISKNLTNEDLDAHLKGLKTIGSYVIQEDGLVAFGVIDVDGLPKELDSTIRLGKLVYTLFPEFSRVLEESGYKGCHIWIFFKKPEKPKFVRELIRSRLSQKDVHGLEVFPKQDNLTPDRPYGNLVKLPSGIHRKSGNWSHIIREERK